MRFNKEFQHSVKVPRIYKLASTIAKEVKEDGASLKDLIYKPWNKHTNIKGLYALVIKTLQAEDVLDKLIKESKILKREELADPWLIRVLMTELLFGSKRLPGESKPVRTVLLYYQSFLSMLKNEEEKGLSVDKIVNPGSIPRYVLVNTLLMSVDDAVKYFQDEGFKLIPKDTVTDYKSFLQRVTSLEEKEFMEDHHIKEMLVFPNKTELYQSKLYLNGSIILQDKASCLASWLLSPTPGSTVLDMCAAPGMKSSHLAGMMKNEGTLFAVEYQPVRYKCLYKLLEKNGVKCARTHRMNALFVDADFCKGVEFILVDPSCSGTGMVKRPKFRNEDNTIERLIRLANFQVKLLCHALTDFPDAKRVVYSTCSINVEENEQVVDRALRAANPDPKNPFFKLVDTALEGNWLHHGSEYYEWGPKCIYTRSGVDLTNGFFIAVFERVRASLPKEEDKGKKRKMQKTDQLEKPKFKKLKRESNSFDQLEKPKYKKLKRESNSFQSPELEENNSSEMPALRKFRTPVFGKPKRKSQSFQSPDVNENNSLEILALEGELEKESQSSQSLELDENNSHNEGENRETHNTDQLEKPKYKKLKRRSQSFQSPDLNESSSLQIPALEGKLKRKSQSFQSPDVNENNSLQIPALEGELEKESQSSQSLELNEKNSHNEGEKGEIQNTDQLEKSKYKKLKRKSNSFQSPDLNENNSVQIPALEGKLKRESQSLQSLESNENNSHNEGEKREMQNKDQLEKPNYKKLKRKSQGFQSPDLNESNSLQIPASEGKLKRESQSLQSLELNENISSRTPVLGKHKRKSRSLQAFEVEENATFVTPNLGKQGKNKKFQSPE